MKHVILGLLAETSIHPGAGQTGGAIDLPVAREAATNYPFVAGSSLKGALLDTARQGGKEEGELEHIFGKQDRAGGLLVSDARLLLLPVRSLTSAYRWVTCPHLLERLARDLKRSGLGSAPEELPSIKEEHYLGGGNGPLLLEERSFKSGSTSGDTALESWIKVIGNLMGDSVVATRLENQFVALNDNDFAWFARYGLAVQARNVLDGKKRSLNLWYEETLPPDTFMYALLAERDVSANAIKPLVELFENRPYLQVGGNETIGQGWFNVICKQDDS